MPPKCAVCAYNKRRCTTNCIFAPIVSLANEEKFGTCKEVFTIQKLTELLTVVDPEERNVAADALAFEAQMRERYPVHGCLGYISALIRQQKEIGLDLVKKQMQKEICRLEERVQRQPGTSAGYRSKDMNSSPFLEKLKQDELLLQEQLKQPIQTVNNSCPYPPPYPPQPNQLELNDMFDGRSDRLIEDTMMYLYQQQQPNQQQLNIVNPEQHNEHVVDVDAFTGGVDVNSYDWGTVDWKTIDQLAYDLNAEDGNAEDGNDEGIVDHIISSLKQHGVDWDLSQVLDPTYPIESTAHIKHLYNVYTRSIDVLREKLKKDIAEELARHNHLMQPGNLQQPQQPEETDASGEINVDDFFVQDP